MTDLKTILKIEFWIQPAFIDHQINKKEEKFYFEVITEIDSDYSEYDVDDLLSGKLFVRSAMDQILVDYNNDFGVVKYEELDSLNENKLNEVNHINGSINEEEFKELEKKVNDSKENYLNELSDLDKDKESEILDLQLDNAKLENKNIKLEIELLKKDLKKYDNKTEIEKSHNEFHELLKNNELTDKNWKLTNSGELSFVNGETLLGDLDLDSLYTQFSEWNIGEGETSTIKDGNGDTILEIKGDSFFNVGLADIKIYGEGVDSLDDVNLYTPIKGGFFIRKDGTIQLGDNDRTRSMSFDLGSVLKIAKRSGTTNLISEIKKLK